MRHCLPGVRRKMQFAADKENAVKVALPSCRNQVDEH